MSRPNRRCQGVPGSFRSRNRPPIRTVPSTRPKTTSGIPGVSQRRIVVPRTKPTERSSCLKRRTPCSFLQIIEGGGVVVPGFRGNYAISQESTKREHSRIPAEGGWRQSVKRRPGRSLPLRRKPWRRLTLLHSHPDNAATLRSVTCRDTPLFDGDGFVILKEPAPNLENDLACVGRNSDRGRCSVSRRL